MFEHIILGPGYHDQVPAWKAQLRDGACAVLEAAWKESLKLVFDLTADSKELSCGRLLGCLQTSCMDLPESEQVIGQAIHDRVLMFQSQSSAEQVAVFLREFPVDPTLQKCAALSAMVAGGQGLNLEGGNIARDSENVFRVGLQFMMNEAVMWSCHADQEVRSWAVSMSSMFRAFKTEDMQMPWVAAVSAVADCQCAAGRLRSCGNARDAMRTLKSAQVTVEAAMLKLKDSDRDHSLAATFKDEVMPAVARATVEAAMEWICSDVQQLTDTAVAKAAQLDEVCRGGPCGKSWVFGIDLGKTILEHAAQVLADKEAITRQIEKAATDATEAARF